MLRLTEQQLNLNSQKWSILMVGHQWNVSSLLHGQVVFLLTSSFLPSQFLRKEKYDQTS